MTATCYPAILLTAGPEREEAGNRKKSLRRNLMKTSFSIACSNNGQVKVRIKGKLVGHVAREGLELLQTIVENGDRKITLDLREMTSLDTLGIKMFDWIRGQNGRLNVDVFPPIMGVNDDDLVSIASSVTTMKNYSNPYDNAVYRRERA